MEQYGQEDVIEAMQNEIKLPQPVFYFGAKTEKVDEIEDKDQMNLPNQNYLDEPVE